MEASDTINAEPSLNPGVPKIPAPPPNSRPTRRGRLGSQGDSVDDVVKELPSPTEDMSTSAQLQVSLEEIQPSVSPSMSQSTVTGSEQVLVQTPDILPPSENNNDKPPEGASIPVYYSIKHGDVAVRTDNIQTQSNGQRVIRTSHYQTPQTQFENERPLTQRYQRILKILSLAALVVFFPTGIPATYFAFNTTKHFNEGILQGNIDKARKFAKRAEKLIIFSFLLAILVVILSLALYERSKWTEAQQLSQHRVLPHTA